MRALLAGGCMLAFVALVACSGGEKVPTIARSGADRGATTTVVPNASDDDSVTTLVPSGPVVTTTTVAGTPVSDQEIYAQAGLTPTQAACVEASGVNGDFTTTPGPSALDATVLESDAGRVAVPASVRTGTELELTMLEALASTCAPADVLGRLAAIDGAAEDAAAIGDDLPVRLFQRKAVGATAAELACIDAGFRASPARLSSLVAAPQLVEAGCASAARRTEWRRRSIDAGLGTAKATAAERACLSTNDADLASLGVVVDAVAAGDVSQAGPQDKYSPTCVSGRRLFELAVDIVATSADFGAETLAGT
ncbi:MAG: hypothetical protein U0Q22_15780 [Acidimicrobiales bacterium]